MRASAFGRSSAGRRCHDRGSAQSIKDHVWGLSYIDEAVQTRINTNPTGTATWSSYWLMQDANYNILGIVNASGLLQERYEYTPYGQRQVFASAGSNDPGRTFTRAHRRKCHPSRHANMQPPCLGHLFKPFP